MKIDLNKTNGSSPPKHLAPAGPRRTSTRSLTRTEPQEVIRLWNKYFSAITLTETRWFEAEHSVLLEEALQIAAQKNRNKFTALDEKNVGKYVRGVLRKLKKRTRVKESGCHVLVSTEVWFQADYQITEEDRSRFKSHLLRSGDCLLFDGTRSINLSITHKLSTDDCS